MNCLTNWQAESELWLPLLVDEQGGVAPEVRVTNVIGAQGRHSFAGLFAAERALRVVSTGLSSFRNHLILLKREAVHAPAGSEFTRGREPPHFSGLSYFDRRGGRSVRWACLVRIDTGSLRLGCIQSKYPGSSQCRGSRP